MRMASAPIAPTPMIPTVSAGSIRARPSALTTHEPGSTSAAASKDTVGERVEDPRRDDDELPQPPLRVNPTAS